MLISEFNQGSLSEVSPLLNHCVHIPRWANEISQQRPFSSVDALLQYAEHAAQTWSWEEIFSALSTHPKIGEQKAKTALSSQEQCFSKREQASLGADQTGLEALHSGNLAYEKKFGFIFLIKASGLDSQQILTALKHRLGNDLETEKGIVHQQLINIALLRLSQELT